MFLEQAGDLIGVGDLAVEIGFPDAADKTSYWFSGGLTDLFAGE